MLELYLMMRKRSNSMAGYPRSGSNNRVTYPRLSYLCNSHTFISSSSIPAAEMTSIDPKTALSPEQLALSRKPENAGVDPKELIMFYAPISMLTTWLENIIDGQWVPTFPNAKYLFSKTEWDFWEQECQSDTFTDDPYYEDSLLPVVKAGLAVFVDNEYAIDDWVRIVPSPGHTPGHVNVCIGGSIPNVVMSGDLMHHPIHAGTDWNSCFCVNPRQSTQRLNFRNSFRNTP